MRALFRANRIAASITASAIVLAASVTQADAATGTVRINFAKAGFIVGVGGGSGTLYFRGRTYRLRVDGVSAGTIGVARAELTGTASNMNSPADITGAYSAVSAGVAIAGGGKTARLQNANGVVLQLQGRQVGFEASLNLGGVNIRLE
jgi:hypothetical protein